ncbi:sorbin and SH3 domain-containing protein 1 [Trichonephila clavata]|uniref:Sorbin and SH3 domain-containing protein 1 n=1 Tax=Trichonephila clavata TaxID=2740835 RepID=A0A8X6KXA0_TRICU|nr:sorbin and SH3 domain-containing protein 1 [Trichonephila clavata]
MAKSRSKFYVDTPLGRDLPSQRHSMFVSQPETDHYSKQDLSSASSSATLPSTAGSVDRLTGLGEKKSHRFFTLKPKTSFSLRPFLSSTSISSLSPSKKNRRKFIETANSRCDSYVQTDKDDRAFDEVGVQTLNASTVDVPVQTCFREWEEDDSRYSYYRRPFASGTYRPGYYRWPSAGYSPHSPPVSALKSTQTEPENATDTKNSVVAPLVSSKLLKYAIPNDSLAASSEKTLPTSSTQEDINIGVTAKPQELSVVSVQPLTVKYFSAKELSSSVVTSPPPDTLNATPRPEVQQSDLGTRTENVDSKESVPINLNLSENSLTPVPENITKKPKESSEVSSAIKIISHSDNILPSALKVERTDSPVRHSAKIKTVHFDLSDSESPKSSPKVAIKSGKSRNLDKDFEALLRDLDILTDDPGDSSEIPVDNKPSISFNSFPELPPKQTILSSKLKSAFDILHQDVLPPILEHSNETCEIEPQRLEIINETILDQSDSNKESESKSNVPILNSETESVENLLEDKCFLPSVKENIHENKQTELNYENDSEKSTSPAVFTSSKPNLEEENFSNRGNVYDSVIKAHTSETVSLPILPSFFESSPNFNKPAVDRDAFERNIQTLPAESSVSPSVCEGKMLSRSGSRSSVRSNSRLDFEPTKFDSCENLEQLEEEIIKSLCEPVYDHFNENENSKSFSPAPFGQSQAISPDAAQIRSAILDRLLSGESSDAIISSTSCNESFDRNKLNTVGRQSKKYTATLTKLENRNDEIPLESPYPSRMDNINTPFENISENRVEPEFNENSNSRGFSHLINPVKNVIELPKNNSVFLFPENNPHISGVTEHSTMGPSAIELASKTISDGSSNNSPMQITPVHQEISETSAVADNSRSKACDFTNCLRPSELQNSPFLNKISSSSMVNRASPEKSYTQPSVPKTIVNSENSEANVPKSNGQCDYANCLKPSQVQNSLFTAELSELTAGKSSNYGNDSLRTNSPLTARTNSPVSRIASTSPVVTRTDSTEKNILKEEEPTQEISHKSEVTIVLKSPEVNKFSPVENIQNKEETCDDGVIELPPVFSIRKEPPVKYVEQQHNLPEIESSTHPANMTVQSTTNEFSQVPPPPPPPPLPMTKLNVLDKNLNTYGSSMESIIRSAHSNLNKTEPPSEPKCTTPKTPVMIELEKHLTHRRRNSEGQAQEIRDRNEGVMSKVAFWSNPVKRTESNEENYFVNQTSPNATINRCNGSNGFSSEPKERSSSLPNGKSEVNFNGKEPTFSSKTIVTDEPPPPGAFLLDKKVTVDGDKVHTDKYYAIPVKEMLKETTTTTKFIPAPPKYEGIGPTEDGVPIGLRNSVKKENMHNWYKTMFKSLHKVDSSLDGKEYIAGYSSEPETSRKDKTMYKKSATLDNRSGNNATKTTENLYKQNYPPSAKSSIEVYKVRPRLIEDYEPGNSSVTDDEISYGSKRYLHPVNTPKPTYEFKNGYEQESNFIRNLSLSDGPDLEQQKVWYKEIQKGGDVPQLGLGKPAPEKPKEPVIGPLPPPPLNYHGPTISQATRPSTLPANYQTDSGICQQSNGLYEIQMRQAIHTEMQHRLSPSSSSQLSSPPRSILKSPSRSPDLKLLARALFDFNAETSKEISLKKGDIVLVLRQLDKNWYEGEKNGCIGIFPISYVEIVPPEHASTPVKSVIEGTSKVRYDFTAQTSVELSVKKGDIVNLIRKVDSNWYECRFNNKKGIIPASYLQVLQEPIEKTTLSPPPPKSCLKSPRSSSETNSNSSSPYLNNNRSPSVESAIHVDSARAKYRGKKGYSLQEPVLYKAMFNYKPQNDDELELLEGDTIYEIMSRKHELYPTDLLGTNESNSFKVP